MNALVVIAAGLSMATALPQFYPGLAGLAPNYPAVAPTTYEYRVVPDVAPAQPNPAPYYLVNQVAPPVHYQSQHHSQDEFGQFSFGYASPGQVHSAVRDFTGAVRGSYSYIDADGKEVIVHYIADHNGFRVASNTLPVFEGEAPVAPEVNLEVNLEAPVFDLEAPVMTLQQVADTPEVEAARAEHFRLVEEQKAAVAIALAVATSKEASKEETEAETEAPMEEVAMEEEVAAEEEETESEVSTTEPAPESFMEGGKRRKRQAVVRDTELVHIVHNPGHATSYRVY